VRVVIDAVADDREDLVRLLRDAVKEVRLGKEGERPGQSRCSCLGDYRITVSEVEEREPPFAYGDFVTCLDEDLPLRQVNPRDDEVAVKTAFVEHSGPLFTGVRFLDGQRLIVRNETLRAEPFPRCRNEGRRGPCDCYVCMPPRKRPRPEQGERCVEQDSNGVRCEIHGPHDRCSMPNALARFLETRSERVLAHAPLTFAVGDRVRVLRYCEASMAGGRTLPIRYSLGRIEERDAENPEAEWRVVFGEGDYKAWAWLASADLDVAAESLAPEATEPDGSS